jgi:2-polyprenyl-6-methoxyphenol hydroxylase-like FAD-dependent oxidoreductase
MDQDGAGVDVVFERAVPRRFDLVIGADGLHSAVRKLAFGNESVSEQYLGYVAAAFKIEQYRPRDEGVYVSYAVPGKQVARFALRGNRTLVLFVFSSPQPPVLDPHDMSGQKLVLRREFEHAGWECRAILDALETADDLYFDPVSQIRVDTWHRGRVGLVGDAAFCPSLLAGQGSALAMTASYVLAGELARARGAPERAFRGYEGLLRPVIEQKQKAAVQFARSFAPRSQVGLFVRNQVSKLLDWPWVAQVVFARSLTDQIKLPEYGSAGA